MKGLIDKNGWLAIERAGKMKSQYCPWTESDPDEEDRYCGDWCPHFVEPIVNEGFTHLFLGCGDTTLIFCELTDERINPDAASAAKPS